MVEEERKDSTSNSLQDLEKAHGTVANIVSADNQEHIHNKNADDALEFILSHEGESVKPEEINESKLVWKIDFFILPLICLLYAIQYMDKLSNSYASIMGLRDDLHMTGSMYSWTGSSFYLGYLVFEIPLAYTLQKFPVINAVSVYIVLWGVILALHAVPQAPGFLALRVILGALESTVTPAFVIVTSQWYKKEEVFLRTALWFSFNGMGAILGSGAIAYNCYNDMNDFFIEAWKLIFIITGCLTIALGFLIFLHIPNRPTEAWFLNDTEKYWVVERIRANQQGFGNKTFKKYQFIEAITDIKTWLYFFLPIASNIPNGGLTNFSSILMNDSMGYSTKKTLLMQMVPGAVEVVGCSLFAYLYRFFPYRLFFATTSCALSVVALCMLGFAKQPHVQMAGYCLYNLSPLTFICILSSIASNVTGHTKKVTVNAIFLIGYCVGNLIGPQTFMESQAPNYPGAKIAMVVGSVVSTVIIIFVWLELIYSNRQKEKNQVELEQFAHTEFADLTDRENPLFRYII